MVHIIGSGSGSGSAGGETTGRAGDTGLILIGEGSEVPGDLSAGAGDARIVDELSLSGLTWPGDF